MQPLAQGSCVIPAAWMGFGCFRLNAMWARMARPMLKKSLDGDLFEKLKSNPYAATAGVTGGRAGR